MKADLCLVLVEDLSRLYFTVFDIVSLTFVLWSRSYLYNVCFIIWHLVANHIQKIMLQQPNDEDPLNHDAAAVLRDDPKKFEKNVQRAMAGGYVGETHFPRCI